ncbi:hypothetical protein AM499_00920 [Bacillus sp. FJAT-22090]|nr:hypothetical protein AM499_00920 [Bacillus sp. FJAT-22090]
MLSVDAHGYTALRDFYSDDSGTYLRPIRYQNVDLKDEFNLKITRSLITSVSRVIIEKIFPEHMEHLFILVESLELKS